MRGGSAPCPNGFSCPLGQEALLVAMYCTGKLQTNTCPGICPNGDLEGIGVRLAFYAQSFINAILIYLSPSDSAQCLWSASILTAAVVIPAMVAKFQGGLTLYHAYMVLNFATLSTVNSLAVAPYCVVWRDAKGPELREIPEKKALIRAQSMISKERAALAAALLLQISLQWAWTIILFVHPLYAQPECSPETKIYVFGFVKRRGEVLADDQLALWVIWLLFSLMLTLWLGIHSVLSSSDSVHDYKEESLPPQATKSLFRRLLIQRFPKDGRNARRIHYWTVNFFVTLVWALYVASSERQMTRNKIFEGENDVASFGQAAALVLILAPARSLIVALYDKLPKSKHSRGNSFHLIYRTAQSRDIPQSITSQVPLLRDDDLASQMSHRVQGSSTSTLDLGLGLSAYK